MGEDRGQEREQPSVSAQVSQSAMLVDVRLRVAVSGVSVRCWFGSVVVT